MLLDVTDNTLQKEEYLMKSFEARMCILQQENAELRQLNEQLQAEVHSVQRMASFTDAGMGIFFPCCCQYLESQIMVGGHALCSQIVILSARKNVPR